MPEHADVSSSNIHEPKGAAAASANTAYIADGAGSGSFSLVSPDSITGLNNANSMTLDIYFDDIQTAHSHFVVAPIAGTVTKIYTVIYTSFTTADNVITTSIGGTPLTNGAITITQSGSAAGDVDSSTPTAANTVSAGQAIEIASDGGAGGGPTNMGVTLVIDVS